MQYYKISYCKIYVKLHVKFVKKIALFFAHFLKHCAHQNLLFFFLFINFSRKPPLLLLLLKINPKTQFHEKTNCLGTLYSVEYHATSTGKLITKGMVDISGHHHSNIAATTSFGGGKARSVGNFFTNDYM